MFCVDDETPESLVQAARILYDIAISMVAVYCCFAMYAHVHGCIGGWDQITEDGNCAETYDSSVLRVAFSILCAGQSEVQAHEGPGASHNVSAEARPGHYEEEEFRCLPDVRQGTRVPNAGGTLLVSQLLRPTLLTLVQRGILASKHALC